MISIEIFRNKTIKKLIISGHSAYADLGADIVCAAVSSISITTVNAIVRYDSEAIEYVEKDGYLEIKILKDDKFVELLLTNMFELLTDLAQKYKKNIKIKKEVSLC